uniref:Death domain-containing protein n=1 Tax=Amphimedon queenslandica TaxID=400682 RepID=A0A1X7UQL2_AMPQE
MKEGRYKYKQNISLSVAEHSERFREFSDKLERAITPSLKNVASKLSAKGLIAHSTKMEATSSTDARGTATKIVDELQEALDEHDDPESFVNEVCTALRNVREKRITDVVDKLQLAEHSKRFREFSDKLENAITPSLKNVASKLSAKGLIALSTKMEATSSTDARGTATKIVDELQGALDEHDDPESFVNEVCTALRNVREKRITDVVDKLEKEIQTSRQISEENGDDDEQRKGSKSKGKKPAKRQKRDSKESGAEYTGTTITSQVPTTISSAPPEPTITQTNPNELSTLGDVKKVLKALKKAMFGPANWRDLGLSLGLIVTTLDTIGKTNGDANDYLEKTIQKWLKKEDQVKETTWQILKEAVKSTGDKAAAERIPLH